MSVNLITTPAMLIEEGIGMAFTFSRLVNTKGTGLVFRPLSPAIESRLFLVWKKFNMFTSASELFLKRIREEWENTEG